MGLKLPTSAGRATNSMEMTTILVIMENGLEKYQSANVREQFPSITIHGNMYTLNIQIMPYNLGIL